MHKIFSAKNALPSSVDFSTPELDGAEFVSSKIPIELSKVGNVEGNN